MNRPRTIWLHHVAQRHPWVVWIYVTTWFLLTGLGLFAWVQATQPRSPLGGWTYIAGIAVCTLSSVVAAYAITLAAYHLSRHFWRR